MSSCLLRSLVLYRKLSISKHRDLGFNYQALGVWDFSSIPCFSYFLLSSHFPTPSLSLRSFPLYSPFSLPLYMSLFFFLPLPPSLPLSFSLSLISISLPNLSPSLYHFQSCQLQRVSATHELPSPRLSSASGQRHLPPVKSLKKSSKRCLTCSKKTGLASSYQCRYVTFSP